MILILEDDINYRMRVFKHHYPHCCHSTKSKVIIDILDSGVMVDILFLDMDIGENDTGMNVVKYILENSPNIGYIFIHSTNVVDSPKANMDLLNAGYKSKWIPYHQIVSQLEDIHD